MPGLALAGGLEVTFGGLVVDGEGQVAPAPRAVLCGAELCYGTFEDPVYSFELTFIMVHVKPYRTMFSTFAVRAGIRILNSVLLQFVLN